MENVPEWIKSAAVTDLIPDEDTNAQFFADDKRELPCHTKAATFVSSLVFLSNPTAYSISKNLINSKLAEFRRLHGVDEAELNSLFDEMNRSSLTITPEQQSQKLASLVMQNANQGLGMFELVQAARELRAQGVNDNFVQSWAFDRPRGNIKQAMLDIALEYGDPVSKKAAYFVQDRSHEEAQAMLCDVLRGIDSRKIGLTKLHTKLASLPVLTDFDVRIAGHDYPATTVVHNLPKIAALTGLQLVGSFLSAPVSGYRQLLESAPRDKQRLAQNCLSC